MDFKITRVYVNSLDISDTMIIMIVLCAYIHKQSMETWKYISSDFDNQGAEYEIEDNEAWTPLHCAARGG